jgi:hypothetical protein
VGTTKNPYEISGLIGFAAVKKALQQRPVTEMLACQPSERNYQKIMNRTGRKNLSLKKLLRSSGDQAFLPNGKLVGSGEGELLQRLLI